MTGEARIIMLCAAVVVVPWGASIVMQGFAETHFYRLRSTWLRQGWGLVAAGLALGAVAVWWPT